MIEQLKNEFKELGKKNEAERIKDYNRRYRNTVIALIGIWSIPVIIFGVIIYTFIDTL